MFGLARGLTISISMYMYVCIHMHIYIYIYINIYIYICVCVCVPSDLSQTAATINLVLDMYTDVDVSDR